MIATFDQFTELPRWVAWRNESAATAYNEGSVFAAWRAGKGRRSANLGHPLGSGSACPHLVNGEGGGIGIELGDLGDGTSLGGIDLDTCRREDGTFEPWAREIIERFASYTEISPSGTGAKIFFGIRRTIWPRSARRWADRSTAASSSAATARIIRLRSSCTCPIGISPSRNRSSTACRMSSARCRPNCCCGYSAKRGRSSPVRAKRQQAETEAAATIPVRRKPFA